MNGQCPHGQWRDTCMLCALAGVQRESRSLRRLWLASWGLLALLPVSVWAGVLLAVQGAVDGVCTV